MNGSPWRRRMLGDHAFACVLMLCGSLLVLLPAIDEPATSTMLEHRVQRDWNYKLPSETWLRISGPIVLDCFPHQQFAVRLDGTSLAIDANGDGALEVKIDGSDAACVTLIGKTADQQRRQYSLRLVNRNGWHYSCASVMAGRIGDAPLTLIDQNLNGRYNDVGADALVVGDGQHACNLSKVMYLGGRLQQLEVSADGSSASWRPYAGEFGQIDPREIGSKAKLIAAVVQSADGSFSFDIAQAIGDSTASSPLPLPCGTYQLIGGEFALGANRVVLARGKSTTFDVRPAQVTRLHWGGPVRAEFGCQRQGDTLTLSPNDLKYYGNAGEEYLAWAPRGESPKFTILEANSGREIAVARFPGSC